MCLFFCFFMVSEDVLVDVGLTSVEAKIYLALFELGFTSVTNISEKTKIHRTNVYDSLKKLTDKGLVSYLKQDNIMFYEASNPSVLLQLLKEKEDNLKKIIPKLLLMKKLSENSANYSLGRGVNSFLDCLFDLLNFESEILVKGIPRRAIKLLGARVFPFHMNRVKKSVLLRQIYSSSLKKFMREDISFTKTLFSDDLCELGVSFVICGDIVLITDWNDDVLTLKINNGVVANQFKVDFDSLWKHLS